MLSHFDQKMVQAQVKITQNDGLQIFSQGAPRGCRQNQSFAHLRAFWAKKFEILAIFGQESIFDP